jgi:cytidylate kinase
MLLVAGDQLTGKSTLAKNLSKTLNGTYWSVGNAFRAVAASRAISTAELSERLLKVRKQ